MQLRGDYNSMSAVNCAVAKTIVTITAPPAAASASALNLGGGRPTSVSTLTLASVQPTLLLEASLAGKGGSVSAANTPLDGAGKKHSSFALGASSASGSGHHVSFVATPTATPMAMPLPMRNSSLDVANSSATSATSTTLTTAVAKEEAAAKHQHAALELRQSVQSQITTLEDVDNSDDDTDSESVGVALVQTTPQLEGRTERMASSSSSSGSVK